MPRTTIGSAVERIRRQLASSFRYEVSMLGALLTASASDTTVQFTSLVDVPVSVREGAVLSVDQETLRVLGVDRAAKTAVVIRGWQDSDVASHVNGSEVWINPRFTNMDIYDAIVAELQSWGPDLYRVVAVETTNSDGAQTVALGAELAGMYGILDVRRNTTGSEGWPFATTAWPSVNFRLVRASTDWSAAPLSGFQLRFTDGRLAAGTLLVQAAMPFDLSDVGPGVDLIADCGLAESMLDVLDMGVKIRLLPDQEIQRSARVAQDTPRMAEEVPPMAAAETAQRLFPIYMRRKTEEMNKLRHKYPTMAG